MDPLFHVIARCGRAALRAIRPSRGMADARGEGTDGGSDRRRGSGLARIPRRARGTVTVHLTVH